MEQTATGSPSASTTATNPDGLDVNDQALVEELRAIEGLTFTGTDEQFRRHAELTVCFGLNAIDGDSDELIADFRQVNPEISEQAAHALVRTTVAQLCPEHEDRLVD